MAPANVRRKAGRMKAHARGGADEPKLEGENASTASLEALVFGKRLELLEEDVEASADEADVPLGGMDDSEGGAVPLASEAERPKAKRKKKKKRVRPGKDSEDEENELFGTSKPAWVDADDAGLEVDLTARNRTKKLRRTDEESVVAGDEYERRLRDQFVKLHGTAGWAEKRPGDRDSNASSDSEEDGAFTEPVATSAGPIAESGTGGLKPHQIDIKCLQRVELPAPSADEKAAVVQSLKFHPESELMLTAGLDKTLRIFAVDGTENAKVATYFFKGFPITGATFTPNGDQVLLTGRNDKMWGLDVRTGTPTRIEHKSSLHHRKLRNLITGASPSDSPSLRSNNMYAVMGDAGALLVCDVPSKQVIRTLRMSMPGVAAVFSEERDVMYSADQDCNIYEWDLATGRCKQRVKATWATGIESLALRRATANCATPMLAVGTASGNIDMYDLSKPQLSAEPSHSIGNLTTMVTSLCFHPEGELLLGASKFKKESLRLMHCATGSVYQNWPTLKTPLNRVTAVDFSRQGGMLAMANERGRVLLYQLRHYAKKA